MNDSGIRGMIPLADQGMKGPIEEGGVEGGERGSSRGGFARMKGCKAPHQRAVMPLGNPVKRSRRFFPPRERQCPLLDIAWAFPIL